MRDLSEFGRGREREGEVASGSGEDRKKKKEKCIRMSEEGLSCIH